MKTTIEISGKGGDGTQTLARIIGEAAILEEKNCSFYPVYDAVVRGIISDNGCVIGISNAYIIISDESIINTIVEKIDITINLNGDNEILKISDEFTKSKKLLGIFLVGAIITKILKKKSLIAAIKNNVPENYLPQNLKAFEAGITAGILNK